METHAFDVIVIGAGIAGATVAAALAADHRVALIEAEEAAGYHSTGRSAAIWIHNYGPPDVRMLTGLSRPFFENPPEGFSDTPLLHHRPVLFLAPAEQQEHLDRLLGEGIGLRALTIDAVRAIVPALKPDYAVAAAIEEDAFDMDVAALHQGFLRQLRARGGVLSLRSRTGSIERAGGVWHVHTSGGGVFTAPVVVNCAGAWGDEVARQAGVAPLGLVPKRRTGCVIDPAPWQTTDWPMINDVDHTWYVRPEARTKLMVSPADETDTTPHDVQPDELDVAIAVDRMQQAMDIEVRRIEHSWAGLRTFTPDRSLAFGWDGAAEGFFWVVGQGGYGIQTSPAAGRLVADLVSGRDPGAAGAILPAIDPRRFAA
ncbi:MAG: FAD-binding oxidoreductase [Acetobacteraceae bacterium]